MEQITSNILMVRPANFGFNDETAINNSFQVKDESLSPDQIRTAARVEFDQMVELLRAHGIHVIIAEDTVAPPKPDAVFPNNWVSFHEDGMVLKYPMFAKARRIERRQEIIDDLKKDFVISKEYTFEHYEEEDMFLEGTGSLILDRENKIAYASLSPRTDLRLLDKWCVLMGYQKRNFIARDKKGEDIYHTNVIMALGLDFCVICLECIPEGPDKDKLIKTLTETGKEIIDISLDQVEKFAGNMLQVNSDSGTHYLVLSSTAYRSLNEDQINSLKKHTALLVPEIPVIEKYGGGSVRCMMAEVFLKNK